MLNINYADQHNHQTSSSLSTIVITSSIYIVNRKAIINYDGEINHTAIEYQTRSQFSLYAVFARIKY